MARLLHQGGYTWNGTDGSQSIGRTDAVHLLGPSASVRVLGPDSKRLGKLLAWWESEVRKMGYSGSISSDVVIDDAFEFLCAHSQPPPPRPKEISSGGGDNLREAYLPDTSVTNASSITLLAEMAGRRVLFLGDAWAEDVMDAVRQLKAQGMSLVFDAIKVSHHGSLCNTSPELLDEIDAPVFFISSDGSHHGHPDFEVLAAIVDRPAAFPRKLLFNYPSVAARRLQGHVSRSGASFAVEVGVTDWIELGATHA